MAKPKVQTQSVAAPPAAAQEPELNPYEGFTGVAFSAQASATHSHFPNYRICTLFIVDGKIEYIDKSQEYAAFEVIARTEILSNTAVWNLAHRYRPGLYQGLGGDAQKELIERLRKTNPEVLERIAPALALPKERK